MTELGLFGFPLRGIQIASNSKGWSDSNLISPTPGLPRDHWFGVAPPARSVQASNEFHDSAREFHDFARPGEL
jgi:hypothetical protein